MSMELVTIEECLIYHAQGMEAIINDGKLIRFEHENSTADNQSDQC